MSSMVGDDGSESVVDTLPLRVHPASDRELEAVAVLATLSDIDTVSLPPLWPMILHAFADVDPEELTCSAVSVVHLLRSSVHRHQLETSIAIMNLITSLDCYDVEQSLIATQVFACVDAALTSILEDTDTPNEVASAAAYALACCYKRRLFNYRTMKFSVLRHVLALLRFHDWDVVDNASAAIGTLLCEGPQPALPHSHRVAAFANLLEYGLLDELVRLALEPGDRQRQWTLSNLAGTGPYPPFRFVVPLLPRLRECVRVLCIDPDCEPDRDPRLSGPFDVAISIVALIVYIIPESPNDIANIIAADLLSITAPLIATSSGRTGAMADLNTVALFLLRNCLNYGADIDRTAVVSSIAFAAALDAFESGNSPDSEDVIQLALEHASGEVRRVCAPNRFDSIVASFADR
jgi:hypothetical protein